ncbi:HAD family hydrolase [Sphingobacterium wenxiniae]|uniref:Haloacid dehalogenase superfamily, subfamily IA, variant 3 with third motif having DD or ED n=1 Tax=Sphingobacterium wenxiniae TaxID=683125 RepID=A0A1I6NUS2_9SPHI|nr:HAD family phosphatase [Sphingobacterium wenxiniae]SFS31681.1 haloacid dehalogenase superfamily, subfamily IA, variant 3 with third motif having DD or ED [Sphingobacterium wenxiniae]
MNEFAVIFDMDGVICDTNPHHAKAFEAFFDKYKIAYSDQEFEEHMYGKHNSYIMSHFFKRPITGDELLRLENEKEALFRELYKTQVETIPHYIPFLHALKAEDFKTGVATSAPKANLDLIVDALAIRELMNSILTSEDVTLHKPHPEVYLKSAERIGLDPSNCLVFEDSFSGITAAKNAGMNVVAVLSSHTREQLPECAYYINDYQQITPEIVKDILRS